MTIIARPARFVDRHPATGGLARGDLDQQRIDPPTSDAQTLRTLSDLTAPTIGHQRSLWRSVPAHVQPRPAHAHDIGRSQPVRRRSAHAPICSTDVAPDHASVRRAHRFRLGSDGTVTYLAASGMTDARLSACGPGASARCRFRSPVGSLAAVPNHEDADTSTGRTLSGVAPPRVGGRSRRQRRFRTATLSIERPTGPISSWDDGRSEEHLRLQAETTQATLAEMPGGVISDEALPAGVRLHDRCRDDQRGTALLGRR